MEEINSQNTKHVVVLKEKLEMYKQTLDTIKTGNVIEDYLLMKREGMELTKQMSILEEDMKIMRDIQESQFYKYENRLDIITSVLDVLHTSVRELKEEVTLLSNKTENLKINDFLKKLEKIFDATTETTLKKNENKEIHFLKDEIAQLKKIISEKEQLYNTPINKSTSSSNKTLQPSSYNQLRQMLNSSNNLHPSSMNERSMLDRYTNSKHHMHPSPHFVPTEGKNGRPKRNFQSMISNATSQNHGNNQLTKKKNDLNLNDANGTTKNNKDSKPAIYVETTENQLNQKSTLNDDFKQSTFNEKNDTIHPTLDTTIVEHNKDTNIFETQQLKNKKLKGTVERVDEESLDQLTHTSSNKEQAFSDQNQSVNNKELKPSIFSILQRNKYFGK